MGEIDRKQRSSRACVPNAGQLRGGKNKPTEYTSSIRNRCRKREKPEGKVDAPATLIRARVRPNEGDIHVSTTVSSVHVVCCTVLYVQL
jgi:hypothetical protein